MEHKGTILLETDHLLLRPFRTEDAEQFYLNWASDPDVTRFLSWQTHEGASATASYLESMVLPSYEKPDFYDWGIELKATHSLIGNISVVSLDEAIGAAELGWVLSRRHWGQGIMPEAARAVVEFLFNQVGVNRVWARHDVNNTKSGRVMQKLGMKNEGTLRQAARNNQGIVDVVVYGLLKAEWGKT